MNSTILGSKVTGEVITPSFDFKNQLRLGLVNGSGVTFTETIATASVSAAVYCGTDATPSNVISGPATISGTVVTQKIIGGLVGVVYDLTITITTTVQSPYKPQTIIRHAFVTIIPTET